MEIDDDSDIAMTNQDEEQFDEIYNLTDEEIKKLLDTDIEDLDIEHDFDQEMKFLSQDKIKKLMSELGELFHMAEDSRVIIEDYDEYMALLKDYLRQVDDLYTALKKYPKLANLIAILMSLSNRIEQAQTLATKKEQQKVTTTQQNEPSKSSSQIYVKQNVKKVLDQNKINQIPPQKSIPKANQPHPPRPIKGMLGTKNVAITQINYRDGRKNSNDFEFAKLDKNGNIIFDKNAKKPRNLPANKVPKPAKEKKNAPKIEKVFTAKEPEDKPQVPKISPSQQQRQLDAYNRDVAARAKSSPTGPNQMSR